MDREGDAPGVNLRFSPHPSLSPSRGEDKGEGENATAKLPAVNDCLRATRMYAVFKEAVMREVRRISIAGFGLSLLLSAALVWGQEMYPGLPGLRLNGFVRFQPSFSTDAANPNNHGINNSGRTLNMFRTWGELETTYDPTSELRLYGRFRLIGDNADNVDSHLRNFDNFPNDFSGNGWMLRGDNNHVSFEAWELFTDIKVGDLWLRLGKQQIVWGDTPALRLLDVVNPLDLSWHLFVEPSSEEFDNIRIPLWFFRGTYALHNPWIDDFNIELIANPGDVVPTLLPKQGSPYNIVPTFVTVNDRVPRGKAIYGGRLKGKIGEFSLTLAAVSKPNDDAIPLGVPPFAVVDPKFGLPTCVVPGPPPVCFFSLPFRFINQGVHPRINIVGGSFNYYNSALGAVFTGEATYTPDQAYQRTPPPFFPVITKIDRRDTWKIAVGVNRPTTIIPGQDPTQTLGLTFFETVIEGDNSKIQILNNKVSKSTETLAFLLSQPFYRKQIYFNFLMVHDFDDATWVQPLIRLIQGDHWRYDVAGNFFTGAEKRPGRFGFLKFANEVFMRATYGF